ncbi:MAG: hypothetical protein ACE37E_07410 [Hyphomicrobiales bacterium]
MRASTFRTLLRTVHIITGLLIGAYLYAPPLSGNEAYANALRFGIIPAVVVTGIFMWKMKWLKALMR